MKTENIVIYLPLRNKELPQHRSCPSAMMAIRSPRKSASSLRTSNRDKEYLLQNLYHQIDCSPEQGWSRKVMANLFSVLTVTISIKCTRLIYRGTYMKWVVKMMVFPALCFSSRSHVPLLAYGSIPEVGSSKNTVCEPPISAIAQLWRE